MSDLRRQPLADLGEDHGVALALPGRGEPDRRARSRNRVPEHGELEPVVPEDSTTGLVGFQLEAVDRHALLGPTATLDADVARGDDPPTLILDHAQRLT